MASDRVGISGRSDLVELADNEYDELAPILMELTSAKDDARVLANVIHIASAIASRRSARKLSGEFAEFRLTPAKPGV